MPRSSSRRRNQPNSLIASAARASRGRIKRPRSGVQEWQREAWYFFDTCGEFRYGVTWRSQACSRATLTITEKGDDGGDVLVTEGPEVEALAQLFGGDAGQSQMLGALALHLDVPGESWIVGEVVPTADVDPEDEVDRWTIYSNEELTKEGKGRSGRWVVDRGDGKKRVIDEDEAVIIRLWRSHPRKWVEANSPARGVLPILREIEGLTKHVAATIDSRLAGAGVLAVPAEMTFATPQQAPPPGADPSEQPDDPFLVRLTDAMMTAIANRDSTDSIVPVLIKAPGAFLKDIRHITFSTPLDEKALELRSEGIRRLALGLDMPPEVLLGLADSNHWSAWQIDESALKVHIEPLLETITTGLTERWLKPAVGDVFNPARRINFSTSELRLRPDRSGEAIQLHDRLAIGTPALLRETGFDEGDAPDVADLQQMVLAKLLTGAAVSPEMFGAALSALGISMPVTPAADDETTPPPAPAEPESDPSTSRDIPDPDDDSTREARAAVARGLLAAGDQIACRAIERAWNRLGNRRSRRHAVPEESLQKALADAYEHVPRVASLLGADAEWFQTSIDRYVRGVLISGAEHDVTVLARVLDASEPVHG